jgi:5-methylcytosine-specific restriction endonuclease McrA
MADLTQPVLRTDVAGMPLEWVDYRAAVCMYCRGEVAYTCGSPLFRIRGGINRRNRRRSLVVVHSIIATRSEGHALDKLRSDYIPPLSNRTLFKRDDYICLYCGERFPEPLLSRDHVRPLSQGGTSQWSNLVTACLRCNSHKAGRSPEAAGMELLAVPFTPTHAEYVYLQGRNVLADQMDFLSAHFPRSSPLRGRQRR